MDRICHELRRPLAVIHAFAELLDDEISGALNDGQKDQVMTILGASNELSLLVHSLYGLAEIDAGRLNLVNTHEDLNKICRRIYEQYLPHYQAANVGFTLDLEDEERVAVLVDERRLALSIAHLVENGLKYTPPGREVTMHVGSDGEWARVRVQDSGLGIPPSDLESVFGRYHRVADDRREYSAKGAGIGLTICRANVEALGGTVTASNESGGACFTLTIPFNATYSNTASV